MVGARGALVVGAAVAVVAVTGLALAEAFHVALFVDPAGRMTGSGTAAGLGVGLLVADIVLPVPSSVVMLAHGTLFGIVPGAALSLLGRAGNAVVGVVIGRSAGSLLGRRFTPDAGRGTALVRRWGLAAVVVTRPAPCWPRARWSRPQPWGCRLPPWSAPQRPARCPRPCSTPGPAP